MRPVCSEAASVCKMSRFEVGGGRLLVSGRQFGGWGRGRGKGG